MNRFPVIALSFLLLAIAVIFAACVSSGQPTVTITTPQNGAQIPGGSVPITVTVGQFFLENKTGQANVQGEGHLLYYMDVSQIPIEPGTPAITTEGTSPPTVNTSYTWENVMPGNHTFSVQLVNNDNTPLNPSVADSVEVFVQPATTTAATNVTTTATTAANTTATTATPTTTATGTSSSASYTVKTGSNSKLGTFLVDGTGRTLYNFTTDSRDQSSCSGGCVGVWPVFYASSINVPSDLKASDFTSFTRSDGSMQTAYKGMPLYYYAADTSPGQTSGQGLNQFGGYWYVVPPDSPGYS